MRERLDLKDCKPGDIVQEDIYKEGIMIPYIVEGAVFSELIRGRLEDIGVETLLIFREDENEDENENEDEDEENLEDIEKDISDLLAETDVLTKKEFIPIYQKHLDYFIELAHIENFKYNKKKITDIFNYYYNENYKDILNIFKYARTSKLKLKDGLVKHSFDSALYALYIGDLYELPEEKLYYLFLGVLLHDFGKLITTKKEVPYYQKGFLYFNKKIDEKEKDYLTPILYHKEYYNGRGKPKGLKGSQIPLLARITTIAESCEKLTRGKEHLNSIKKLKSGKYKKILDQTIVIKLIQSLDI